MHIPWTPEEEAIIRDHYLVTPASEIQAKYLPHRSYNAVKARTILIRQQDRPDSTYTADCMRICPSCQTALTYSTPLLCRRAKERETVCGPCNARRLAPSRRGRKLTEEHKAKCVPYLLANKERIRDHRAYWTQRYGADEAERRVERRRQKLSTASKGENNPMYGKPSPQGSGNGWKGWYRGWHFRSLRELQYFIRTTEVEGRSCINIHLQKAYRVPYQLEGVNRSYTPDFLVDGRYVVEIKPVKLLNTRENKAKFEAATPFFAALGLTFQVLDIEPDSMMLKAKYLAGEITFTTRYENRFRRHIGLDDLPSDLPNAA